MWGRPVRAAANNNGSLDDAFDLLETIASLDGANYIDEHVDEGLLITMTVGH